MASFTLTREDVFPDGTDVGAYLASSWHPTVAPSGAPPGSASETATVTDGAAEFTDLDADTAYFFAAQVSGTWRYVRGRTDPVPVGPAGGVAAFEPNHDYTAGTLIVHDSTTYYANVDFTSANEFDAGDWLTLPGGIAGIPVSEKGAENGVATLGEDGILDPSQRWAASTVREKTFSVAGDIVVGAGTARFYLHNDATIVDVRASLGTAPDTTAAKVDVNKNAFDGGGTLFTTQANRPTIDPAAYYSGLEVPDVTAALAGDYLTVDVDERGSQPAEVVQSPAFAATTSQTSGTSGTSYAIDRPSSDILTHDIHILRIRTTHNDLVLTDLTSNGWTAFAGNPGGNATATYMYFLWRYDTGAGGPWAITRSGGAAFSFISAAHIRYRYSDPANKPADPIDASSRTTLATGTGPFTPPALTTTLDDATVLMFASSGVNRGLSTPDGYTPRNAFNGTSGTSGSYHFADKVEPTAGLIDAPTFTASGSFTPAIMRIALKPITVDPPAEWAVGAGLDVTIRYVEA